MSHESDDRHLLTAVLRQEARRHAEPGDHPEPEELLEYVEGKVDGDRGQALRNHLVACPRCAAAVVDLADFATPAGAGEAKTADFGDAVVWRDLRRQLRLPPSESGTKTPNDSATSDAERAAKAVRVQRWLQSAALAVLCLGLGYLAALYSAPGPTGPQVDVPLVYLDAVTRDDDEGPTVAAAADGVVVLILTPTDETPTERYRVVIEGETDAARGFHWSADGLTLTDLGSLRLALPRSLLPPGDYRVTLSDLQGDGAEPRPAARHTLRVLP